LTVIAPPSIFGLNYGDITSSKGSFLRELFYGFNDADIFHIIRSYTNTFKMYLIINI